MSILTSCMKQILVAIPNFFQSQNDLTVGKKINTTTKRNDSLRHKQRTTFGIPKAS